jgi:SAM-dependent methyltransferase
MNGVLRMPKELLHDYRQEFYSQYHVAVGARTAPQLSDYEFNAHQFWGRWGKWLPSAKDSIFLDLACGNAEFLYFVRKQGYTNTYGVDLNEVQISFGQQMGIPNLECNNLFDYLKGKENAFDVISAFNIFEHLKKEEILDLLKLVHQALKPGGRLLAVTPNGLSPISGSTRYHDFSHETSFTPASWRQLARLYGFQQSNFEDMGPIPHSVKGKVRLALWRLVRLGIMAYNYIELASPGDASKVYTADMKIILFK